MLPTLVEQREWNLALYSLLMIPLAWWGVVIKHTTVTGSSYATIPFSHQCRGWGASMAGTLCALAICQ